MKARLKAFLCWQCASLVDYLDGAVGLFLYPYLVNILRAKLATEYNSQKPGGVP